MSRYPFERADEIIVCCSVGDEETIQQRGQLVSARNNWKYLD